MPAWVRALVSMTFAASADIERLRVHVGVRRWLLTGGAWGSRTWPVSPCGLGRIGPWLLPVYVAAGL